MADGTHNELQKRRTYDLEQRLVEFALRIIDIVQALEDTRTGNYVGGQLLRCGTSPAAHYGEAQAAESRPDFVHKMKVILKELRESRVWLILVERKKLLRQISLAAEAIVECDELISIFVRSIQTARRNLKREQERT